MHIGMQLICMQGLGPLEKGETYHFLRNDSRRDRVLLIKFAEKPSPKAILITINRSYFEQGCATEAIQPSEEQRLLPPWLNELEGVNFELIDSLRQKAKKSHRDRVYGRLETIWALIQREDEFLSAEDVEFEINRFARSVESSKKNETRVRTWFFTYLLFGSNVWALLGSFHRTGHWSRQDLHPGKKFGRSPKNPDSLHDHGAGHEMITRIENSYVKYRGRGKSLRHIYVMAITKYFGCLVAINKKGFKYYYHSEGKPYPTYYQYEYWVIQKMGLANVQKSIYGEVRYRTRLAASVGSYSELLSNLMHRIEVDAYSTNERPTGLLEHVVLEPLYVVRARCVTSGALVGVGFSLGAERSSAYRMMLFSMAIPKVEYCALFGIPIHPDVWPCLGMPGMPIADRGAGAKQLIDDFMERFPIREFAPSWQGQSKATVESSHPRNVQGEGQPIYVQSDLNPVEMARREVERLIKDHHTSDASARRTPEMIAAGIVPSPHGIWTYLDSRARTDARPMSFDTAVRTFLTPLEFTAHANGIYFGQQLYDSTALRSTGLIDQVATGQRVKVNGYIVDMSVRRAWVEIQGRLITVDARLPIRDDDEQLYMSLQELEDLYRYDRLQQAQFREHKLAVNSDIRMDFEAATGKDWDAGRVIAGRPKSKSREAQQEQRDIDRLVGGRR